MPEKNVYQLSYRAPFDWESLVKYLSMRTAGGAETIIGNRYLRTVKFGKDSGWLEVSPDESSESLILTLSDGLTHLSPELIKRLRRLFDLDADPDTIAHHLGKLSAARPGLRVSGAFDTFEMCIRAILGQVVSVKSACNLMARYVSAFGESVETPYSELTHYTPVPSVIISTSPEAIAQAIRVPLTRARAIWSLADATERKILDLDETADPLETMTFLKTLPGIGDWTAHYIAMHALGWSDAFPHGDLALRKLLNEKAPSAMLALAEPWRPWRSYAVMHLWKSLED